MNRTRKALMIGIALAASACVLGGALRRPFQEFHTPDVVYVGTPYDVVSAMLRMARIKKDDLVYDLGCGDGRMVVLAAKKYGCRGMGFDIDPERVSASRENLRRNGVEALVKIVRADLMTLDFREADVLSLYLLPEINEKLVPQFEKLKPGSRLVFHDYGLEGFKPDKTLHVISNEDNMGHTLYLYTTPLQPISDPADANGAIRSSPVSRHE
jgi:SAM-dependent methyltransferase